MQSKYCPDCNHKNEYSDTLPKFCNECGKQFSGTILAQVKPVQIVRPIKKVVAKQIELEEEITLSDEEYESRPHNEFKIELEIQKPQRQKEVLRNLAFDTSEKVAFNRPKQKVIKNKTKLEQSLISEFKKGDSKDSIEIGGI